MLYREWKTSGGRAALPPSLEKLAVTSAIQVVRTHIVRWVTDSSRFCPPFWCALCVLCGRTCVSGTPGPGLECIRSFVRSEFSCWNHAGFLLFPFPKLIPSLPSRPSPCFRGSFFCSGSECSCRMLFHLGCCNYRARGPNPCQEQLRSSGVSRSYASPTCRKLSKRSCGCSAARY